ncbi:hypothetical protein [Streptomyces goshikiensis]|uniref:hypothetical protein n=1 Tax=Streptomyces goshikiensis TaxID=1942 RepID=UPI00364935BA
MPKPHHTTAPLPSSPTLACAQAAGLLDATPDLRSLISAARRRPVQPDACVTTEALRAAGEQSNRGGPAPRAVGAAEPCPTPRGGQGTAVSVVRQPHAWS